MKKELLEKIKNRKLPIVIAIEGMDGAGKHTQSQLLVKWLIDNGIPEDEIIYESFPRHNKSPFVDDVLNGKYSLNNVQEHHIFMMDRMLYFNELVGDNITRVMDIYDKNKICIFDRYIGSSFIYNTKTHMYNHYMSDHALKLTKYNQENSLFSDIYDIITREINIAGSLMTNMVLFLDVKPEISRELLLKRYEGDESKMDKNEASLNYQQLLYEKSKMIIKKYKWKNIKCYKRKELLSVEEIHNMVTDAVTKSLEKIFK